MVDDSQKNENENVDDKSNEDSISKNQQFAFDQAEDSPKKFATSISTKRKRKTRQSSARTWKSWTPMGRMKIKTHWTK